eukprot:15328008-Ditylum_brightwellii.AAC.1
MLTLPAVVVSILQLNKQQYQSALKYTSENLYKYEEQNKIKPRSVKQYWTVAFKHNSLGIDMNSYDDDGF